MAGLAGVMVVLLREVESQLTSETTPRTLIGVFEAGIRVTACTGRGTICPAGAKKVRVAGVATIEPVTLPELTLRVTGIDKVPVLAFTRTCPTKGPTGKR